MNEEEVQIDLMTLLHYILRKWRSIIVMMLILAVAANLYSVKKSMAEVAAAGEVQEKSTDKEEGYESGADSYLTKPFSAKLLNSRVHNLLESRKKLALIVANRTKELKPEQQEETIKLNKLDEEFLTKFTTIVEENIDMEKMDMSFMMEKMNMSHSTLYLKSKSLTGMSGNELIRKIRLKNSLRLLMEEGHNISEAAYASGFNDLGYFRSCFREEYGMAPSEYIRLRKSQD